MNDSSLEGESNYQVDYNYNENYEEQKDVITTKYQIASKALESPVKIKDIMSKLNIMENTTENTTEILWKIQ